MFRRKLLPVAVAAASLAVLAACGSSNSDSAASVAAISLQNLTPTATPIKHVVVIYGENVSFDHYFATYPDERWDIHR